MNTDLVQVQGRVQNAQRQLPNDLQTPQVSIYDPSEAVVVSLVASSRFAAARRALVGRDESRRSRRSNKFPASRTSWRTATVTPSIQVERPPAMRCSRPGFTLTDVTNTIANNNVRAPGGIAYAPNRETNIDIRGDVTTPPSVADLLLSGGCDLDAVRRRARSVHRARYFRIGDVATVTDTFEPQRVYAYTHGAPSIALDVQKASNTSEVQASEAVLHALPGLERAYPDIHFDVLNVQATYTREQLSGVIRTLIEAIVFTGIVMLFFLHSWRNAVVVMIAIPTSLLVTLAAMRLANFTLDTVSLLAMTLIIGILVDDSIVVLENIERHHDDGEDPRTRGRHRPNGDRRRGDRHHAGRRRRVSCRSRSCRVRSGCSCASSDWSSRSRR